jgi:hypothetical protein
MLDEAKSNDVELACVEELEMVVVVVPGYQLPFICSRNRQFKSVIK